MLLPLVLNCGPFDAWYENIGGVVRQCHSMYRLPEVKMAWTSPKILEISCGMEINRYAPADDTDPIQY